MEKMHFQVNVCGGDFDDVARRFEQWRHEPLVYRASETMFRGRSEVRKLTEATFDDAEAARHALEERCRPSDDFALAAEVDDGSRDLWLVMAAYREG